MNAINQEYLTTQFSLPLPIVMKFLMRIDTRNKTPIFCIEFWIFIKSSSHLYPKIGWVQISLFSVYDVQACAVRDCISGNPFKALWFLKWIIRKILDLKHAGKKYINTDDPIILRLLDIVTGVSNLVGGRLRALRIVVSSKQQILIKFLVA